MVQNIAVVGLNRDKAYEVSKTLAKELDMFFFDALELFEFDNIPRTFPVMLKEYGIEFFRKKEKSIIGYASEFTNCVINLESGFSETGSNFDKIEESSLLVYLAEAPNIVKEYLEKKEYKTEEEKDFFNVDLKVLQNRSTILQENANLIVNAAEGSVLKITSEIIRSIKNYYKK